MKELEIPPHIKIFQLEAQIEELKSILGKFIYKSRGNKKLKELARIGRKCFKPRVLGDLPESQDL